MDQVLVKGLSLGLVVGVMSLFVYYIMKWHAERFKEVVRTRLIRLEVSRNRHNFFRYGLRFIAWFGGTCPFLIVAAAASDTAVIWSFLFSCAVGAVMAWATARAY